MKGNVKVLSFRTQNKKTFKLNEIAKENKNNLFSLVYSNDKKIYKIEQKQMKSINLFATIDSKPLLLIRKKPYKRIMSIAFKSNRNYSLEVPMRKTSSFFSERINPNFDLENILSSDKIGRINTKLAKLKEHIKSLLNDKIKTTEEFKVEVNNFGQILINYIVKCISVNEVSLTNIKSIKKINKEINALLKQGIKNTSFIILIERIKIVVKEKIDEFVKKYRENMNIKEQNSEIYSKLEGKSIVMNESIESNKVSEINSDINYNNDKTFTSISSATINLLSSCEFNSSVDQQLTSEKKEFYKIVLKSKFEKLHSTHIGQKIPQKKIYEEAQKLKIPKNEWENFIFKELNNPYKYIDIQKKKYSRSVDKKRPMSIIPEEQKGIF